MRIGLTERRLFSWVLALIAVMLVAGVSYVNGRGYVATQSAVREAIAAREAISDTLSVLKDVETGARGFLLTGDEKFLEPFRGAQVKLPAVLRALDAVAERDPDSAAAVSRLQALAHRKLEHNQRMIELRSGGEISLEQAVRMLEEGKRIMDTARREAARMTVRSDARLHERERATASASSKLQLALGAGLLGAVLLTLAGLSAARKQADSARRISEQLERDVSARKAAEQSLREQTRLLELVLANIGDGVVVMDRQRKLVVINPAAQRIFPYVAGDTVPIDWALRSQAFLTDGVTPFPSHAGPLTRAVQGESSDAIEMVIRAAGELRSYSVTTRPITEDEQPFAAVAVYRDTTEMKFAEKRLLESEHRYRVLSEASFEGVVISRDGVVVDSNQNFASWLGYAPEELLGMDGIGFFAQQDQARVLQSALHNETHYEATLRRRDGSEFPVEVRSRFVISAGQQLRIAAVRDVTEKKRREAELEAKSEQLHALSIRDELTGLHNRRGFMQLAQAALSYDEQRHAAVFFADLNGMKLINDKLGHEMGDHAIRAAAEILRELFGESALIARLGGDEFAVFVSDYDASDVRAASARLEELVQEANACSTQRYRLSISMGAATNPPHRELGALMQAADAVMYEVKRVRHQRASLRVSSA